jgi:hypothetical protein
MMGEQVALLNCLTKCVKEALFVIMLVDQILKRVGVTPTYNTQIDEY